MLHLIGKENFEFSNEELGYNYDYEFPYLHTHDYWEFVYSLYPIIHHINGTTVRIDEPSVFIIKPEDRHSVTAVPPPENPKKYPTILNLKISEKMLERILSDIGENLVAKMHKASFSPKKCDSSDIFGKLIDLKILPFNPANKNTLCSLIKTGILTITLQFMPLILDIDSNIFEGEHPEAILKIAKKLSSQAYFSRRIDDITKSSFYSKKQLTRLFKKSFSMTMNEYFLSQKLDYAKKRLTYTEDSILKISLDVGMSLPHFDSFFKQETGMTPLGFRKNITKNINNKQSE